MIQFFLMDDLKPLLPDDLRDTRPTPAPAWVALACAWIGLLSLLASLLVPFLPGSRNPLEELERGRYALSDQFFPLPMYGSIVGLFLGIVTLWQMRREPRPLNEALAAQRLQALVGLVLAGLAVTFLYAYVAWQHS